jgi:hypothetical protein
MISDIYDISMVKEVENLITKQLELSQHYSSYLRPINVQRMRRRANKIQK